MISKNAILQFAALAITFVGAPAMAVTPGSFDFADELDACVTALNGELDLSDVYKIRHIVTKFDSRGRGYSLTIRTQTFAPHANKVYSATCVAAGKNLPSKLEVAEINT
jgi:hypothetical protein